MTFRPVPTAVTEAMEEVVEFQLLDHGLTSDEYHGIWISVLCFAENLVEECVFDDDDAIRVAAELAAFTVRDHLLVKAHGEGGRNLRLRGEWS